MILIRGNDVRISNSTLMILKLQSEGYVCVYATRPSDQTEKEVIKYE